MDLFHGVHQLVGGLEAHVHLEGGAELGCLPEDLMDLGVGLEVMGLEEVGPQNQELFLAQVRLLFLDGGVGERVHGGGGEVWLGAHLEDGGDVGVAGLDGGGIEDGRLVMIW